MHHVIEQEKRIMCQKQRILNGEHKVELLKSSENWYHVVKELSVSCKGAKEKVEKCKIWAQVEDVYSVSKPQEKDEDMTSIAKESQLRCSEANLLEPRAHTLIKSDKRMQAKHMKYPVELGKIKSLHAEREKLILPREAELEAAKKLIKNHNYYDRKACGELAKCFCVGQDTKEVRDVLTG
ncbi:hypothetical protein PF008_g11995 [Phytophthora fragariae]|uniref:Uncharacterized protein n=1 Tax=Phytophthora fragariae TaxID=53985 RepID=A0A6G0RPN9_9STRA|nr:hypothetical protein PF008_g11995 [Phytophthora fragariae]